MKFKNILHCDLFFRSDTNLLTTASPALDEWLRAMTGLTTSAGEILDARHTRSCAIMACIMAEAHDNLENHQPLPKVSEQIIS